MSDSNVVEKINTTFEIDYEKLKGRGGAFLIVPIGKVGFVIYDDRKSSQTVGEYFALDISNKNYKRLTVPQNLWVAFCGIGKDENIILNIASEEHDRNEVEKKGLDDIHLDWSCF